MRLLLPLIVALLALNQSAFGQCASCMQDAMPLPDTWFTCSTADECVTVRETCYISVAVNIHHVVDFRKAICPNDDCVPCTKVAPDNSFLACESGHCLMAKSHQ